MSDIEAAGLAVKSAQKPRIHTFISTSDLHLKYQFKMTPDEALKVNRVICSHVPEIFVMMLNGLQWMPHGLILIF